MSMEISSSVATYQEAPKVQRVETSSPQAMVVSEVAPEVRTLPAVSNEKRDGGKGKGNGEGKQEEGALDDKKIKDAVNKANNKMRMSKSKCEFSYHEKTNRISIKVVDEETSEVIREIPPDEAIEMFEKMLEIAGLLVDERR